MQSSFKSPPPSFIEEIQRDLRATTMRAKHIIFMGYSLPPDDVDYRALFAASCKRSHEERLKPVRCTIVGRDDEHDDWCRVTEDEAPRLRQHATVRAVIDLFGDENVRFYGRGVPDVFLDNGKATDAKLDKLLTWSVES
jgi:hypothetical protein